MTLQRLLIANRGEIAIRIARTAADMEIESVAVYAEDDAKSLHVRKVDQALALEGRGVRAYLDMDQLVFLAKQIGCDAIHPGYGFLSENADFARRCAEEGLVFVGAPADLLELLGNKARARQAALDVGTPLIPGLNVACTLDQVREFHAGLGEDATVMIKALAGGGGRGMRAVTEATALEAAYNACRDEAGLAFGSSDVYVEQYIPRARHIEVQLIGDGSGRVSHAWERECTLQRRHQKLLEMAPSPTLSEDTRAAIIDSALRLASSVEYRGLGTFEYLLDANDPSTFYFMEINPRIQVEHTVTEEITGLDLIRTQIELAAGRSLGELGLDQAPPRSGFSLQARINLEHMQGDGSARPAAGVITAFEAPGGHGIRLDHAVYPGLAVNPSYDSLAAKLIVSGSDYPSALRKLQRGLRELRIEGVHSNRDFLLNLVSHPDVVANRVDTGFLSGVMKELLERPADKPLFFESAVAAASDDAPPKIRHGHVGIASPTAGELVALEIATGEPILAGQAVARVEAMKMEFTIQSDTDGIVTHIHAPRIGEIVREGQLLVEIEPGEVEQENLQNEEAADLDFIRADLAEVAARHELTLDAARPQAVARRHAAGKRTARENVANLLDAGSFNEYGAMAVAAQRQKHPVEKLIEISPADGLIAGTGHVNGEQFGPDAARCAVLAYDYTVMAGTQGFMNHKKSDRILALAKQLRLPLVLFAEGGGGRPSDTDYPAVAGLDLHTFAALAELSGLVPSVAIAAGNCFAGNAALFGLCDLTVATRDASIGMAGPAMIEGGGLGRFRPEEVGPASVQSPNGVVDVLVADDVEAVSVTRKYLSYFQGAVAGFEAGDQRGLRHLVPENRKQVYDMREVVETLADTGSVLELRREFARSAITALARIEGIPVGLMANNPHYLGGAIDADAGDKFARFMKLCDAHDLPMVVLCDTPGFMVGPESEKQASVRHVARMFVAAANATIPIVTIVLRKGYGLGAMAMAAGGFGCPVLTASWPSGEFGAMGLEGAVRLSARRELESVEDPQERQARFESLLSEMVERGKALNMASFLEIDAVIDPMATRDWVRRALAAAPRPSVRSGKKHPYIDTW